MGSLHFRRHAKYGDLIAEWRLFTNNFDNWSTDAVPPQIMKCY